MRSGLILFILIGITVGLLWPAGSPPAASAVASRPATEAPRDKPVETVLDRQDGHYFTHADVNDQPVRFLIDTGASMVALTQDDAKRIGVKFDPNEFVHIAHGASGPVYGQRVMLRSVTLDGKRRYDVHGAVVEGLELSLLGQSFLNKMDRVEMRGAQMRIR